MDASAMVCTHCSHANGERADRDGADLEVLDLEFEDFSNDKADLNVAQQYFNTQIEETRALWDARWNKEDVGQWSSGFAKLFLAEGLRITAEAKAAVQRTRRRSKRKRLSTDGLGSKLRRRSGQRLSALPISRQSVSTCMQCNGQPPTQLSIKPHEQVGTEFDGSGAEAERNKSETEGGMDN